MLNATDAQEYISVGSYQHTLYFTDSLNNAITPLGGCTQGGNQATVTCGSATVTQIEVNLGGGADRLVIDTSDGSTYEQHALVYGSTLIRGGAGNDRLVGAELTDDIDGEGDDDEVQGNAGSDTLKGGAGHDKIENDEYKAAGNDTLDGGAGPDELFASSALDGADTISGGDDVDTMSYFLRGGAVSTAVTLDGQANDGADSNHDGIGEEGDDVKPDVENVNGGSGSDFLQGSAGTKNVIQASGGNDRIDVLHGDAGDTVYCGSGTDEAKIDNEDTVVEGFEELCETVTKPAAAPGGGDGTGTGGGDGGGDGGGTGGGVGPKPVVSVPSKQQLKGNTLALTATCTQACTLTTRGSTISIPGGAARVYKLKTVTKKIAPNKLAHLKVKLPAKVAKAVKSALKKGKKVRARLKLTAYYPDPSGRVGGPTVKNITVRP